MNEQLLDYKIIDDCFEAKSLFEINQINIFTNKSMKKRRHYDIPQPVELGTPLICHLH